MKPVERILAVTQFLLKAKRAVPFEEIAAAFPAYQGENIDSAKRAFERDKGSIRALGLDINYIEETPFEAEAGYLIKGGESFLPPFRLSDAERALLVAAANDTREAGVTPFPDALRTAAAKIGADGARDPSLIIREQPASEAEIEVVQTLSLAIADRCGVEIVYERNDGEQSKRRVDGYGLIFRQGAFYLVGHDHLRGDERLFRCSRIKKLKTLAKNQAGSRYEIPAGFSLQAQRRLDPLHFNVHEPLVASVRLDPELHFLVKARWGEPDEDGVFRIETRNVDRLITEVLSFGRRAELLEPAGAREEIARALRVILEAHLTDPSAGPQSKQSNQSKGGATR